MFGYVYKTTNLITKKIYIGKKKSSKFLGSKYLGSGMLLSGALLKYGRENFSVCLLEECFSQEDLNKKEIY